MKHIILLLLISSFLSACSAHSTTPDPLSLYRELTRDKSQLDVRIGAANQYSGSEKICLDAKCDADGNNCKPITVPAPSPLMTNSDDQNYYQLTQDSTGFSQYGAQSQYATDIDTLRKRLDDLMWSFKKSGLIDALKQQKKTPALMFDIDNTLEFSAAIDSDPTGKGPAIQGMVDFAKQWCFKDGVDCYFVTARNCENQSAKPTQYWLEKNMGLDAKVVDRFTYFSRNTKQLVCSNLPTPTPNVAYKDIVREALEAERKVFWLMSIGDQLTDSLGEHSGLKVRVPNQFFHADINPNQFATYGVGHCGPLETIVPPLECSIALKPQALAVTNINYCRSQ
ncbi:hypothetical protein G3479_14265 [Shewanella baltica]|uniref:hypothetical protein n=1 Tax=Shewanella baltica TaxID=62322 RepID=UPI00217D34FE|nr:hypothetical protein [Shewanella baltica]MCS6260400.1 hypothetical protein [Shewanella baltica]